MIFRFENWLNNEKELNAEAKELFKESILCFRAGAYISSFLICYVGFLTSIQYKLLIASKPDNFDQKDWDRIQTEIRNEETWDKEVFNILSRKQKKVFSIDEDTQALLNSFRAQRNICAHNKNFKLFEHNVIVFWSFIMQRASRLAVGGTVNSYITKTEIHFNPLKTQPNTSFLPLAGSIINNLSCFEVEDYLSILKDIMSETFAINEEGTEFDTFISSNFNLVLFELVNSSLLDEKKLDTLSRWILKNYEGYIKYLISRFPTICRFISFPYETIRQTWISFKFRSLDEINSLSELLDYIPQNEWKDLSHQMIQHNPDVILQIQSILMKYEGNFKTVFMETYIEMLLKDVFNTYVDFDFANKRKEAFESFLLYDYRIESFFSNFNKMLIQNYAYPGIIKMTFENYLIKNEDKRSAFLDQYKSIEYDQNNHIFLYKSS